MKTQEPPALAIWLLERLGSGSTREAVTGDLVEQFTAGRSGWWFWRWDGSRRTGLAKIYRVALTMPLPATVVEPQPATLLNSLVLISIMHTAIARASAGWLVGRLHRPLQMAMVLLFLSSLLA